MNGSQTVPVNYQTPFIQAMGQSRRAAIIPGPFYTAVLYNYGTHCAPGTGASFRYSKGYIQKVAIPILANFYRPRLYVWHNVFILKQGLNILPGRKFLTSVFILNLSNQYPGRGGRFGTVRQLCPGLGPASFRPAHKKGPNRSPWLPDA